jgi:hypothetical protein
MDVGNRERFSSGTQAYSGARLERAVTPGGQRLLLEHLSADGDWLTRATDGHGRARRLWEAGALVMTDVSEVLLPPDVSVTRAEVEWLPAGLARLHANFEGAPLGDDAARARTARLDAWWKARVLVALETWSPV